MSPRTTPRRTLRNPIASSVRTGRANQARYEARGMQSINYINNSGETLIAGDVVIIDTSADNSVTLTDLADTIRIPLVVMIGAIDGEIVKCYAPGYGKVTVTADAEAVAVGNTIIASDTQRQATVSDDEEVLNCLGVAVTTKAGGASGEITVQLNSGSGAVGVPIPAPGSYVHITGDTMTGDLIAPEVYLTEFNSGTHGIAHALDDTINCGILHDITVVDEGGINISWDAGMIWDCVGKVSINTDAHASTSCVDDTINYLYWDRSGGGTALTLSTTKWDMTDNDIPVGIIVCQGGDIYDVAQRSLLSTISYLNTEALHNIFKVIVTDGLIVSEDTNITNPFDVEISAGTFYHHGTSWHVLAAGFNTRTIAMTRWFHNAGVWTSDTNAEIDAANWDDPAHLGGWGLSANTANKYYKSVFMYSDNMIHWIYPQVEYNTIAQAIAAPLPTIPTAGTFFPYSTAVILKGNASAFPPAGGEQWIDVRPRIAGSVGSTVQDHGSLGGLTDDDHTQYALLAGRASGQVLIGGTAVTDGLTLQTTSGVGEAGADMHFLVGNDGATEPLTIYNSGLIRVSENIEIIDDKKLLLGTGNDGEIYSSGDDLHIRNVTSDKDVVISANDGGVERTFIHIDSAERSVGIHTSPGFGALDVRGENVNTALYLATTVSGSGTHFGLRMAPQYEPIGDIGTVFNILSVPKLQNSAYDITDVYGSYNRIDIEATYTGDIDLLANYTAANLVNNSTTSIIDWIGFYALSMPDAVTNAYGLKIDNITGGTSSNYAIYTEDGLVYFEDQVSIGTTSTDAQLHVDQPSTTRAMAVALFDQGDVDEPFLKFIGTAAGADLTRSIVAVGDVTTATVVGYVKIEVEDIGNQVADGDYYVEVLSLV